MNDASPSAGPSKHTGCFKSRWRYGHTFAHRLIEAATVRLADAAIALEASSTLLASGAAHLTLLTANMRWGWWGWWWRGWACTTPLHIECQNTTAQCKKYTSERKTSIESEHKNAPVDTSTVPHACVYDQVSCLMRVVNECLSACY